MFAEIELNKNKKQILHFSNFEKELDTNSIKANNYVKIKPKWEWYDCDFIINQQVNNQQIYWSSQPSISFSSEKNPEKLLDFNLSISMEKQFDYDDLECWNWHKTWIIPTISVNIKINNQAKDQNFIFPKNIKVGLMAVKPSNKNSNNFYLIDVGLQNMKPQQASLQNIFFHGLKFSQTSYKHERSKFNLVVALFYQQQHFSHPLIISCKISPPIFVDSRKSAREDYNKKVTKMYESFAPEMMDKVLYKRVRNDEQQIYNSDIGFINYFTAPNIRNKIRNPFFLAYRFSKYVTLFYNSQKIPKIDDIVKICMKKYDDQQQIGVQNMSKKKQKELDKLNPDAYISLVLQCKKYKQTQKSNLQILQKFGSFDSNYTNVIFDPTLLPKKFLKIQNSEQIKKLYQEYFYEGKNSTIDNSNSMNRQKKKLCKVSQLDQDNKNSQIIDNRSTFREGIVSEIQKEVILNSKNHLKQAKIRYKTEQETKKSIQSIQIQQAKNHIQEQIPQYASKESKIRKLLQGSKIIADPAPPPQFNSIKNSKFQQQNHLSNYYQPNFNITVQDLLNIMLLSNRF